jgi:anti-sigma B factor antagonist
VTVLRVFGELDLVTCPRLEEALASIGPVTRVIVDLTRCTLLDSCGVRTLVEAQRDATARERGIDVVTADPNILRVFEITNVNTMLTVHSSLDAAL